MNNISISYNNKNCSTNLLSFDKLSLTAGERTICNNFTSTILYDGILLIKGAVGMGKSTLLKAIAGVYSDASGEVLLRSRSGTILESVYLHSQSEFNFVTGYVKDELKFAGITNDDFKQFEGRSIYDLSGGELKKLSVMMWLGDNQNRVILFDEPLDMLDDIESAMMAGLIITASKTKSFIIATHDKNFDDIADVVIELS